MKHLDIKHFSEGRTKARGYFCYLFSTNLPSNLPSSSSLNLVIDGLKKIKSDLQGCEGAYLLDHEGTQITPTFVGDSDDKNIEADIGKNRSQRAYFYRAVQEQRCSLTDPYPSLITHDLTVTASAPIYCKDGELKYVACIDVSIDEVFSLSQSSGFEKHFRELFKFSYAVFAFALFAISLLLFINGIQGFFSKEISATHIALDAMFRATIILTLSLAIFDLAKTIIEEEVIGITKELDISGPHKTMVKFLGSIIIALSIEALMLVFKFAITDPEKLMNAMYIIAGVGFLIISLAVYIKFTRTKLSK